jgi:hypothetical protein
MAGQAGRRVQVAQLPGPNPANPPTRGGPALESRDALVAARDCLRRSLPRLPGASGAGEALARVNAALVAARDVGGG